MVKRYAIDYNLKNGLGHPAISLYLTGCDKPVKCKGCHNWEMQERSGQGYNIEDIKSELDNLINNFSYFHKELYISIVGGEPLAEYNLPITIEVAKYIKDKHNSKIVLYSWRDLDQIGEVSQYLDYAVLGGYDEAKHQDNVLPSSSNQVIWDFKNNKELEHIKLK